MVQQSCSVFYYLSLLLPTPGWKANLVEHPLPLHHGCGWWHSPGSLLGAIWAGAQLWRGQEKSRTLLGPQLPVRVPSCPPRHGPGGLFAPGAAGNQQTHSQLSPSFLSSPQFKGLLSCPQEFCSECRCFPHQSGAASHCLGDVGTGQIKEAPGASKSPLARQRRHPQRLKKVRCDSNRYQSNSPRSSPPPGLEPTFTEV